MNLIKLTPRLVLCGLLFSFRVAAVDFSVSNNGFTDYVINGVNDPTLNLVRGRTYTFSISASGHPFWIKTAAVTGTGSAYSNGVSGNGTQVGTLTFSVPSDAPDSLFYICQFHFNMRGTISIADPPAEPAVLSNPRVAGGGVFEFDVIGHPGRFHSIEASTNAAVSWTIIGITNAPPSGAFTFADTNAGTSAKRYYRVVSE